MPESSGRYMEQEMVGVNNPADLDEPNILEYYTLLAGCCTAIKDNDNADISHLLSQCAVRVREKSFEQVKMAAVAGSAEDSLQAGLRMYVGCTTRKDQDGALWFWLRLVDKDVHGHIPKVSRSLRARAYSCMAHYHDDRRIAGNRQTWDKQIWNIDALYRSGKCADDCAALGLVTPKVIVVGANIERAGFRRKEDNRFPEHDTGRFEALENLWEVYDKRIAKVENRIKQVEDKKEQNPNAYICAAPGCGVEATKKSALLSCAGPCGLEIKPSYCSKECQVVDWKRHRRECKPYAKEKGNEVAVVKSETTGAERFSQDGKEHVVHLPDPTAPGKTIRVASKTMSPAFLKEVRESTYRIMEEQQGSNNRPT